MYRRKAFSFNYVQDGMEYGEIGEAMYNMRDLMSEYQQYEIIGVESDDEMMEEEMEEVEKEAVGGSESDTMSTNIE